MFRKNEFHHLIHFCVGFDGIRQRGTKLSHGSELLFCKRKLHLKLLIIMSQNDIFRAKTLSERFLMILRGSNKS